MLTPYMNIKRILDPTIKHVEVRTERKLPNIHHQKNVSFEDKFRSEQTFGFDDAAQSHAVTKDI